MTENVWNDDFRKYWKPRLLDASVVSKKDINWSPVEPFEPVTRLGGRPSLNEDTLLTETWPYFENKPLPFFGQVVIDEDTIAYVFLDDTVDGSWQAQNGANAVLVSGSWEVGQWLETRSLPEDLEEGFISYSKDAFAPDSGLDEPKWLQGDETPEGHSFLFQFPSQVDGGSQINIGQGYGDVYVFLSEDRKTGKVLWQS